MRWLVFIPVLLGILFGLAAVTRRWSAKLAQWRSGQNIPAPIHPLMHIPVPWVFVAAYLAGVGLQFLFPVALPSVKLLLASRILGASLLGAGSALAVWCLLLFRKARTTTIPFATSSKLVTWGPYPFTRNPMYLGLTLIYLGEAGLLAQIWPLPFLLLTLIYLNRVVIPFEEARLREVFGATYDQYCARVRRWL